MNFQCSNCGGNVVFDPASGKMLCKYCGSFDSEQRTGDRSVSVCASCGGEITVSELSSADKCPYCGNYLVFDDRVSDAYEPARIIPFSVSKEQAVEAMKREFKHRTFAPADFLSDASVKSMEGNYVPFFLYSYDTETDFRGVGTKVRSWVSGNTEYTETSYFQVVRKMRARFSKIPADASYARDDNKMDLLEPFNYGGLKEFNPKFMSGFLGEVYNAPANVFEQRVKARISHDADRLIAGSYSGYSTMRAESQLTEYSNLGNMYTLLPVWVYNYSYGGKNYEYFINGQTGKVIGETPIAKKKVIGYSFFFAFMVAMCSELLLMILEVL